MEGWLVAVIVILCVGGCLATIVFGCYSLSNLGSKLGGKLFTAGGSKSKFTMVNATDKDTEGLSQSCHKAKFDNL